MNYKIIFIIEILAFISISFWAAAMEGPIGGIFGIKTLFGFNADFYIFNLTIPLFLLMILIIKPEIKLVGTLATGYLSGIVLEDFFWFVLNPYYGIQKFNSQSAVWLIHWTKIGNIEIPLFYVRYLLGAFLVWFIFVYNSEKVNKLIKIITRKYLKIK
jgi:hypothetical protein